MKTYKQKIELYFDLKGTPASSRESYSRRIQSFITYLNGIDRSVEEMTIEDIQHYILHLKRDKQLSPGTINNYISAIKLFYTFVLEQEWNTQKIPRMKRETSFPVIPPKEEILFLIENVENVKHKAMIMLLYGSGLRVSEVAQLKIRDICSQTMRIRVEKAKHDTSRYTILSQAALHVLREYFKSSFASIPLYTKRLAIPWSKSTRPHKCENNQKYLN
ncbi:tyrosine-type recombinase/integrase [Bacillus sp. 2205SS5-2]|uniref:tyrosine-type recombinase/integrase n=1 Tax=Bacillus sp. 2205SS5-2 TaxID=3109031 RepID=UPI003004E636